MFNLTDNYYKKSLFACGVAIFLITVNYGVRLNATEPHGKNLVKGLRYTFSTKPNYKLCTDKDDNIQLTDGYIHRSQEEKRGWVVKSTVGWAYRKKMRVIFDLGALKKISGFAISVLGGAAKSGVSFPNVTVYISKDNKQFTKVKEFVVEAIPDGDFTQYSYQVDGLRLKARYVKFELVAKGFFTFVDELEVFAGNFDREQDLSKLNPGNDLVLLRQVKELRRDITQLQTRLAREKISSNMLNELQQLKSQLLRLDDKKIFEQLQEKFELLNARIGGELFARNSLYVFTENSYLNFSKYQLPSLVAKQVSSLTIAKAINENEMVAFMLFNTTAKPLEVKLTLTDLINMNKQSLNPNSFEFRVSDYSLAQDQKYYADPLPLIENNTLQLAPGERKAVWLISKAGAKLPTSATYDGEVILRWNSKQLKLPLTVKIYPVELPQPLPVNTMLWGYISLFQKSNSKAEVESLAKLQKDVYVDIALLHPVALPKFNFSQDGKFISADFRRYDEITQIYLRNGIKKFCYFILFPGGKTHGFAQLTNLNYEIGTAKWNVVMSKIIKVWVAHNKKLGLDYQNYSFYPYDGPINSHIPVLLKVYRIMKQADKNIRIFMNITSKKRLNFANLKKTRPYVDIYCSSALDLWHDYLTAFKADGGLYFTYRITSPDKTFSPLEKYRFMAIKAFNLGISGISRYSLTDFKNSAWTDLDASRADMSLIYDSKTAPAGVSRQEAFIPSRRLFAWRDGVEDYVLLWMLKRKLPAVEFNTFTQKMLAELTVAKNSDKLYEKYHLLMLNKLK